MDRANYVHSNWSKVAILSGNSFLICSAVATVIFFKAWDKSRDSSANRQKLKHMKWTLDWRRQHFKSSMDVYYRSFLPYMKLAKIDMNFEEFIADVNDYREANPQWLIIKWMQFIYRTHAIITRGLYTFYPLFEVKKRFFKGLFS